MKERQRSVLRLIRRQHASHRIGSARPLGLLLLGLMLGSLLMGCQISKEAAQRDPFLGEMMQLQQQQDSPHKFGETFDVGNTRWKIAAAHATLALRLGSHLVKPHGKFVIVDFTFTNLTDTPQRPTADMLQLADAKANIAYRSDAQTTALLSAWQKTSNFLQEQFQPNQPYTCSLAFDIPVQASNLVLNFQSFPTQDVSPGM